MPNSQQDRPTSSHEHIPVFTKQPTYFWDQEAVKEPGSGTSHGGRPIAGGPKQAQLGQQVGGRMGIPATGGTRTIRDVWSLAGDPWRGEHHAAYPLEIPRRAILAGTSAYGVCSVPHCSAPWRRVVERTGSGRVYQRGACPADHRAVGQPQHTGSGSGALSVSTRTIGWEPTCAHRDAPVVPAIVLDPFCGSATTLQAARELGRHAIGLDLSWTYLHRESRTRLGLAALAAWQHGEPPRETPVDDLPLFAKETPNDV
jgi:hypothetical protein